MDELSPTAREALRRYHGAAGLGPAARTRVWRDIEASLEREPAADEPRASDRRGQVIGIAMIVAAAAAVIVGMCDVRGRLGGSRRVDSDAAVYEAAPGPKQVAEPQVAPGLEAAPVVAAPEDPPKSTPRTALRPRVVEAPAVEAAPQPGLAAEVAWMRQARAAIDRGAPEEALRALAEHAAQFAAGQMVEERQMLRIEALCALERGEAARAEAEAFLRAHPGSTHATRVRNLCRAR